MSNLSSPYTSLGFRSSSPNIPAGFVFYLHWYPLGSQTLDGHKAPHLLPVLLMQRTDNAEIKRCKHLSHVPSPGRLRDEKGSLLDIPNIPCAHRPRFHTWLPGSLAGHLYLNYSHCSETSMGNFSALALKPTPTAALEASFCPAPSQTPEQHPGYSWATSSMFSCPAS